MAKVGRPTNLTEDLTFKIRALVFDGQSYEFIKKALDIPDSTWDSWVYRNCEDFRSNLTNWKHERMIKKAETNIEVLQESEDERVNLQANTFVLETLAKKEYSKRNELTGKNGDPIEIATITGMRITKE